MKKSICFFITIFICFYQQLSAQGLKSEFLFDMLLAGKSSELFPSDYYFRTNPVFETSSPKYKWLNHTMAIGVGHIPVPGKVAYKIYAIR